MDKMSSDKLKRVIKNSPLKVPVVRFYRSFKKGSIRQILFYFTRGHIIKKFKVRDFMKRPGPKYLQYGGGFYSIKGWLNADIIAGDIYANAAEVIPLNDNTIDAVFTEQFIEHLSLETGRFFMREAFRVLKPGCCVRLGTPDLKKLINVYLRKNEHVSTEDAMARHQNIHSDEAITRGHFLNDLFRMWGHQFIYDEETLKYELEAAGFIDVETVKFGQSKQDCLNGLERHADAEWMKDGLSIFVEARKPL